MRCRLTEDIRSVAETVHEKRLSAGAGKAPRKEQALAEAALVTAYGRDFQVFDLQKRARSVQVIFEDEAGRSLRVIYGTKWPFRVYSSRLDVDLYVMSRIERDDAVFYGWITRSEVESAPIWFYEEEGVRRDFAHEVERPFLAKLPEVFDFQECPHFMKYGGIWDYTVKGHECFGCGKFLHDGWGPWLDVPGDGAEEAARAAGA